MSPNFIISSIIMLSFAVVGNYLIHLFYKNKRKQLFKAIAAQPYIELKKVNTEIYTSGSLGARWTFLISDIILLDDNLFLLLSSKVLKMNQSTLQISKKKGCLKYDGVGKVLILDRAENSGNKVKLISTIYYVGKTNIEIKLNFKEKANEQIMITEFIDNKM